MQFQGLIWILRGSPIDLILIWTANSNRRSSERVLVTTLFDPSAHVSVPVRLQASYIHTTTSHIHAPHMVEDTPTSSRCVYV